MSYVLSIDPAGRHMGWAFFELLPTRRAHLVVSGGIDTPPAPKANLELSMGSNGWVQNVDSVVNELGRIYAQLQAEYKFSDSEVLVLVELPDVYGSATGQAASNSGAIIKLMAVVFAVRTIFVAWGCKCLLYPVRVWKGTLPKEITQKRIVKYWRWGENAHRSTRGNINHNEADAVGIGDYHIRQVLGYTAHQSQSPVSLRTRV